MIVGGGPTGVELAGTIADLARDTLPRDFRAIDTRETRVLLVEAGPRVLNGYPGQSLGLCEARAGEARRRGPAERSGHARSSAGRSPSAASASRRTPSSGRRACARRRRRNGWARRRTATDGSSSSRTSAFPDIRTSSRSAIRSPSRGRRSAGSGHRARGEAGGGVRRRDDPPAALGRFRATRFRYRHEGSLAQIGKGKAVIDFGWLKLRGSIAWWFWGLAHIYFLVGVRSRLSVALNWLWIYTRNQRGARLITQSQDRPSVY